MKKIILVLILSPILLVNYKLAAQNWVNGGNYLTATGKLGTKSNHSLSFITNNTERGRITNGGNWGIGTGSPASKLAVNSAAGASPFRTQVNGNTKLLVHSGGGVAIGSNTTPPANGLYVSGNVGIGTDNTLESKLYVTGHTTITGGIYVPSGGVSAENPNSIGEWATGVRGRGEEYGVEGISPNIGLRGDGQVGLEAISSTAGGDGIRSKVSGTSNYGINSYSANSYGIYGSTGNSSSYAGYFKGNVYSTGSYLGSDAKLKKNITNVDNAMNIIRQLQPRNYEYRDDGNFAKMNLPKGKHYGFVAQDLEKVLPNLVKQTQFNIAKSVPVEATPRIAPQVNANETDTKPELSQPIKEETIDFKAVNYIELIPIMIKAMQEQQSQYQQLSVDKDKKIADLQNQINDLKSLISRNSNGTISSVKGYLKQNTPNPAINNTVISYLTPDDTRNAQILLTDMKGSVVRAYNISKGEGQVNIRSGELPTGSYNYTLYINNNKIVSRQMVIMR